MIKILNFFVSIVVILSSVIRVDLGYGLNPTKKTVDLSDYKLVWSDEFSGNEIDRNKWNDSQNVSTVHWGAIRRGGYWHKDMISVHDGALHIETKYVNEEKAREYGGDYKAGWYTGFVCTNDSNPADLSNPDTFLYGYMETRCILPSSAGLWSAFWMMNSGVYEVNGDGKDGTEIDIFEGFGYEHGEKKISDLVSMNLHWDGYNESHQHYHVGSFYADEPYTKYNTYGLMWTPDEYVFYINGHECARTSKGGVSHNPENLILSVEIAGENGVASEEEKINKNGKIDFIIDYVKVYQQK